MARSPANLTVAHRFVAAVQGAQGRVPEPIVALLGAADTLMAPRPVADVVSAIIDEVTSKNASAAKIDELLAEGARQQSIDVFRGDVARRAESVIVQKLHKAFAGGAADTLLDSLRDRFDEAAEQIAEARSLIPSEQRIEEFLATATSEAVAAWQSLPRSIATCEQIAGIAAMFGCRSTAVWPLIEPYTLGDASMIDDRALFACDGPSVAVDSGPFNRADTGGRSSPWFKVARLKLHDVKSARERYRRWAESEWETLNSGPRDSVRGPDGQYHELPKPPNPYRLRESAHA